jgi:hypothetical protein
MAPVLEYSRPKPLEATYEKRSERLYYSTNQGYKSASEGQEDKRYPNAINAEGINLEGYLLTQATVETNVKPDKNRQIEYKTGILESAVLDAIVNNITLQSSQGKIKKAREEMSQDNRRGVNSTLYYRDYKSLGYMPVDEKYKNIKSGYETIPDTKSTLEQEISMKRNTLSSLIRSEMEKMQLHGEN